MLSKLMFGVVVVRSVMKRGRDIVELSDGSEVEALAMANCLMLLSQVGDKALSGGRVFTCKTCNRHFPTFQALGGHRASHKRPRLTPHATSSSDPAAAAATATNILGSSSSTGKPRPKMHACSICGDQFPIGQALGGHMRRHRTASPASTTVSTDHDQIIGGGGGHVKTEKSRVLLRLDLNLTPFENCLKFGNSNIVIGIV